MMMEKNILFDSNLSKLRVQHAVLQAQIENISAEPLYDQLAVQRLKRLRLQVREQIEKIQDSLLPDIIA